MTAEIVTLQTSNFRDPAATLRQIADEIEAGKFGGIGCLGIVILGDTLEVFGAGPDSDGPEIATVLHAGFNKLCNAMVDR